MYASALHQSSTPCYTFTVCLTTTDKPWTRNGLSLAASWAFVVAAFEIICMNGMNSSGIADTPKPPYFVVIFTSLRTAQSDGYDATAARMQARLLPVVSSSLYLIPTLEKGSLSITGTCRKYAGLSWRRVRTKSGTASCSRRIPSSSMQGLGLTVS